MERMMIGRDVYVWIDEWIVICTNKEEEEGREHPPNNFSIKRCTKQKQKRKRESE